MMRSIRLPALATATDAQEVRASVAGLLGVQEVNIDLSRRRIRVRYDVRQIDCSALVEVLERAGYPPAPGWLSRLRLRLYQYADTNARENAKAPPPPCCNKPPR